MCNCVSTVQGNVTKLGRQVRRRAGSLYVQFEPKGREVGGESLEVVKE